MRFLPLTHFAKTAGAGAVRRPFDFHNHQCRAWHRFSPATRPSAPSSQVFNAFSISRRSYSSNSANSTAGFLAWYLGMLQSRPILTKAVSSAVIYAVADCTSQYITMEANDSWSSIRTLRVAGFGLFLLGPSQHVWFNFVARVLPKTDVISTLKKLAMGQLLFGPVINSIFFSYNAALQGESGNEITARLKRDLLPTMRNGLMYWPFCDFLTYKVIPVHLQPLLNSSFSFLWSIYLTYMASLAKAVA